MRSIKNMPKVFNFKCALEWTLEHEKGREQEKKE